MNDQKGEKMRGMMLHCGGQVASMEDIRSIAVPEATGSWYPMGYVPMIEPGVD